MALHLQIPRSTLLSTKELAVEGRFADLIESDVSTAIIRYLGRFGRVIDTDRARELCRDYAASDITRARWSRATYNPAKAVSKVVFQQVVDAYNYFEWPARILFTSGGSGSGKSTALEALPPKDRDYEVLMDGTLADFAEAQRLLTIVLKQEWEVVILHVYLKFEVAVRRMIERAIKMGRVVTLDNMAATHFQARETFLALARLVEEGRMRGSISLRAVYADTAVPIQIDDLEELHKHSLDSLRQKAQSVLENEYGDLGKDHPQIRAGLLQPGSRLQKDR